MTDEDPTYGRGTRIREAYEEYDLGDVRVGLIADPQNPAAWIESTDTRPLIP